MGNSTHVHVQIGVCKIGENKCVRQSCHVLSIFYAYPTTTAKGGVRGQSAPQALLTGKFWVYQNGNLYQDKEKAKIMPGKMEKGSFALD